MKKLNLNPRLKIERVPSKKKIELINNHSFTYVDEKGKTQIQNVQEFAQVNRLYIKEKLPISKKERLFAGNYLKNNSALFGFFSIPNRVIWSQFQTPIRNQSNRNTCSGFAMVAAIEARYKRDYDLDLDLSEQFFWHSYKSTSLTVPRKYKYENQSSIWGGGNSQGVRSAINFAIPLESDCPYLNGNQMSALRQRIPAAGALVWRSAAAQNQVTQEEVDAFEYSTRYIPHSARQKAAYGAKEYLLFEPKTIRNTTSLRWLLAMGNEVIVDANLKWKTNTKTGVREYDASSGGSAHCMLVVGYDHTAKVFYLKNSWGESGLIKVSYEFASKCFGYGSIITKVTKPGKPSLKGRALGRWKMNHDGWKGELIIRRYTNEKNEITRLGHYKGTDGKKKAVNGTFIDDNRGISFSMTSGDDTAPTVSTGQKFNIDIFSWDIKQAAGTTKWKNIDFGTYLHRDAIHSVSDRNFKASKWKGEWAMNHDGHKGKLTISKVVKNSLIGWLVIGHYKKSSGSIIPFHGTLHTKHPHILQFNINFSNNNHQPFVLHFHNWSRDLASGYTFWNNKRFGTVMSKR